MSIFYKFSLIIVGCALAGFGTATFLLPNQISSGGFAGIATVIYYFFNIQMGTTIFVLNIPLFILGYIKLGKKFVFKTIIATFLYSKFIDVFGEFNFYTEDRLLSSIYGGILIGLGLAIVLKAEASTGGTDLIAHLAQNFNINMKMSNVIVFVDIAVVIVNLIAFKDIEVGLYSAISIYIIGKMIDIVFEGVNFSKIIYIISDKHEEILEIINKEIKKGATALYGRGSFTGKNRMVIMCVSKRRDIDKIKTISRKIDKNSFIIITEAREVYGLGFKS